MDNKQIKMVSLVLLVFVIVFSITATVHIMDSDAVEGEIVEGVNSVTTGKVTINVQNPPTTQGEVKIEIVQNKGDQI